MKQSYRSTLETIFRQHHAAIIHRLQSRFPNVSVSHVQDAVADAFTEALVSEARFSHIREVDGDQALEKLLQCVAWRRLRAHLRKRSSRCEVSAMFRGDGHLAEPLHAITPCVIACAHQDMQRAMCLVDEAAVRFGGRRPHALRAALHERLHGGTDSEAARAHGVPREYVNRAKKWIGRHLSVD